MPPSTSKQACQRIFRPNNQGQSVRTLALIKISESSVYPINREETYSHLVLMKNRLGETNWPSNCSWNTVLTCRMLAISGEIDDFVFTLRIYICVHCRFGTCQLTKLAGWGLPAGLPWLATCTLSDAFRYVSIFNTCGANSKNLNHEGHSGACLSKLHSCKWLIVTRLRHTCWK